MLQVVWWYVFQANLRERYVGGEKGKRDVNAKWTLYLKTTILKYETERLKTKLTDSFEKSTDSDAKQTMTDGKPTVIHWIDARWRAKRQCVKSIYPFYQIDPNSDQNGKLLQ